MQKIEVRGEGFAYPVFVGEIEEGEDLRYLQDAGFTSCYLFIDEEVARHWGDRFSGWTSHIYEVPSGEDTKRVDMWEDCLRWLARKGADRSSLLIVAGGGVASDLGGFVAGTYMRGIRYATFATTLLAQVDAAVGGKTGVNLPEGKNLVGVFHHPLAVWCDPRFLSTLAEREFVSGVAEVIKYGFVRDPVILEILERDVGRLSAREGSCWSGVIARCCQVKAEIVNQDPQERLGLRSVLNFGHTVGHGLEVVTDYKRWRHGEAVMLGMIVEAEIGARLGITLPEVRSRLEDFARAWSLPYRMPSDVSVSGVVESLFRDKKAVGGSLALALVSQPGECHLVREVPVKIIEEVLGSL
jgi:3-dehydroquinate synthase